VIGNIIIDFFQFIYLLIIALMTFQALFNIRPAGSLFGRRQKLQ